MPISCAVSVELPWSLDCPMNFEVAVWHTTCQCATESGSQRKSALALVMNCGNMFLTLLWVKYIVPHVEVLETSTYEYILYDIDISCFGFPLN